MLLPPRKSLISVILGTMDSLSAGFPSAHIQSSSSWLLFAPPTYIFWFCTFFFAFWLFPRCKVFPSQLLLYLQGLCTIPLAWLIEMVQTRSPSNKLTYCSLGASSYHHPRSSRLPQLLYCYDVFARRTYILPAEWWICPGHQFK